MIHFAKLENSERLQRVHRLLSDGEWYSTRQIIEKALVCAVNTAISELRANGLNVECRQRGIGRFEYRLA